MRRDKTNLLNIYRLREGISLGQIQLEPFGYELDYFDADKKLYVLRANPGKLPWVTYFAELMDASKPVPESSSSSVVYLHQHGDRCYAIAGGYGYTKIEKLVEEDFGLEIATRIIKDSEISALNQRELKGNVRQIFRAVSGYNPIFDADNHTRLLRYIQGKGEFEQKSFTISGKASVSLRTKKPLSDITEVFGELETIETRPPKIVLPKAYKLVTDQSLVDNLECALIEGFDKYWTGLESREKFYLDFKEPLVQFKCEQFRVIWKRGEDILSEFDLDLIKDGLKTRGLNRIQSTKDLKRIFLVGLDESGYQATANESLFDCLEAEVQFEGSDYIKFHKQWFLLRDELKSYLDDQISQIEVWASELPQWNRAIYREEREYNEHLSDVKNCVLMDADSVHFDGNQKLELCDSYDPAHKVFYHIKKTWGAKSSYLYLQGSTSLEYFVRSNNFFSACKGKWPAIFTERPRNGTVAFGIADQKATESGFPNNLTYFAKLNLIKAVQQIKTLEYKVVLCPIEIL
jgi:uncharacterized protein (TIGR04141 family)